MKVLSVPRVLAVKFWPIKVCPRATAALAATVAAENRIEAGIRR
jgi:hypothetical protein